MFSSKTPRDLNHDPKPFVGADGSRKSRYSRFAPRHDPRAEFDHVQHNEPNPILVAFRAQGDPEFPGPWIDASYAYALFGGYREWDDPRSYFHAFVGASGAQNRHARHVLTRLAALTAVTL